MCFPLSEANPSVVNRNSFCKNSEYLLRRSVFNTMSFELHRDIVLRKNLCDSTSQTTDNRVIFNVTTAFFPCCFTNDQLLIQRLDAEHIDDFHGKFFVLTIPHNPVSLTSCPADITKHRFLLLQYFPISAVGAFFVYIAYILPICTDIMHTLHPCEFSMIQSVFVPHRLHRIPQHAELRASERHPPMCSMCSPFGPAAANPSDPNRICSLYYRYMHRQKIWS